MIYSIQNRLGPLYTVPFTAGSGGVKNGDIVSVDASTGKVVACTSTSASAYGWAAHDAQKDETVHVWPGAQGVIAEMPFADANHYTGAALLNRHYGIEGLSGSMRVDLSDTDNKTVNLVGTRLSANGLTRTALVQLRQAAAKTAVE